MEKLLAIEFIKLKKLTALKVIFIIYMFMIPLIMYVLSGFYSNFIHPFIPIIKNIWGFPFIWQFTTYSASFFNILMGIIVVIVVCNEYNYKTFKQNIIDGLSMQQVILGKFLVVVFLSTLVTVYTALTAIVFGVINSETNLFFEGSYFILLYFLQTLCYFSFAFFFAVLIKRTALSIILFIVSFIAEMILGSIVSLTASKEAYLYFPLNVFSKLTPNPLMDELNKLSLQQTGQVEPQIELWTTLLLSLTYMVLFFLFAYIIVRRRDL